MPLPFDRVNIVTPAGPREISAAEFCALPLAERLRVVLERRVQFLRGEVQVDSNEALKALRESVL